MFTPRRDYRRFSATFLAAIAFVFGFWGLCILNIQYRIGYTWLPGLALLLIGVVPLAAIVADIAWDCWHEQVDGRAAVSAILITTSAYTTVFLYVVEAIVRVLGELPQKILGLPSGHQQYPWWFSLLIWKTVISAVVIGITIIYLLVSSIMETALDFDASSLSDWPPGRSRPSMDAPLPSLIAEYVLDAILEAFRGIRLCAHFVARALWQTLRSLKRSLWMIFHALRDAAERLALPVALLSAASLLLLIAVNSVVDYSSGLPSYTAPALWGGLVCSAITILTLCLGAAGRRRTSSRDRALLLSAGFPTLLFTVFFYILITFASLILPLIGYLLRRTGMHMMTLDIGPLQIINLCSVTAFLAAAVIPDWLSDNRPRQGDINRKQGQGVIIGLIQTAAASAIVGCAIVLGYGPMIHWFTTIG